MPWLAIGLMAAPTIFSMLGNSSSRNRGREQPFLDPFMAETLQNRANARTYASWAADPTSVGFRNTAAMNEEKNRAVGLDAVRNFFREAQRRDARGVLSLNPERRDETLANATANVARQAHLDSFDQTVKQLLGAANANQAGSSIPPGAFEIYGRYGDAEAQRRSNLFGGFGDLFKLFGGMAGGGGGNSFGSLFGGGGGGGSIGWDPSANWSVGWL